MLSSDATLVIMEIVMIKHGFSSCQKQNYCHSVIRIIGCVPQPMYDT